MDVDAAAQREELLRFIEYNIGLAIDHGLVRLRVEDQAETGESITVGGTKLINFGSCAYLGLNVDRRLKDGAIAAVEKYGPVFSSSAAYTSVDLYTDLEARLERIFGGHILVPTTTTLGHLSVLPVLVGAADLVLMDHQVHASVQLTSQILRGFGATVVDVPHNDMGALAAAVRAGSERHPRVWYLADGVYSMYGDTAPVADIVDLLDAHPNLHVYIDDAHGVGWKGLFGKGHVLTQTPLHERMIVIGSLSKSWGAGGAVLVLPNGEMAESVLRAGATFSFSGPLHPAELGAAVAAADIHLSPERDARAARLMAQIDYVRARLIEHQIPVMSLERTPLWFVRAGSPDNALELARRMMMDGFYVNLAGFPVVPIGMEGFRFTNTIYHTDAHLEAFMDSLARHLPELYQPLEIYVDLR